MSSGLFATPTPTAFGIPQADGSGFIDTGWLHASVTPTPNDLVLSDGSGHISPDWLVRGNFSSPAIFQQTDGTGAVLGTGIALTLSTQAAALVWAGPVTGAAAAPTFRALATTDIPSLSSVYQPINAKLTSISALANAVGWLHNDGSGGFTYSTPGGSGTVTSVGSGTGLTGGPITGSGTLAVTGNLATLFALTNAVGWLHNDGAGVFAYSTPTKADVGLGSVENTALSTWAGSANLTTLGTIATGVWGGTAILDAKIASAATWNAKQAAITFGTGVQTALGVNIGSAGAPVLFNGALGTPTSGTLTNCTFPTLNQNTSGTAAGLSATLAVTKGGTGLATIASGKMLYASALNTFAALSMGNSLVITGGVLDTIQDIRVSASPQFYAIGVGVAADSAGGIRVQRAGIAFFDLIDTSGTFWRMSSDSNSSGGSFTVTNITGGFEALRVTTSGAIQTRSPSGGTAQPWKFGSITTAASVLDTTRYIQAEINGVACKLALIT